jgi:hypothetical protein
VSAQDVPSVIMEMLDPILNDAEKPRLRKVLNDAMSPDRKLWRHPDDVLAVRYSALLQFGSRIARLHSMSVVFGTRERSVEVERRR